MSAPIVPGGPTRPPLLLGREDADVAPEGIGDAEARRHVRAVRADPTVVRPLVVRRVRAPLALFRALLDDLPRAAAIVERMGAGRYRIEALPGSGVVVDDGAGARAEVDLLLDEEGDARVYRARGRLKWPALPELRGTGVIALRFEREPSASPEAVLVGGRIDFRLESGLLHALARPLARLLRAVIDAKVHALVDAAVALCEAEARRLAAG